MSHIKIKKNHICFSKTLLMQRGVHYSTIKVFSHLPQNIFKFYNNLHIFKILLRDYLVKNAFYSNEEFFSSDHGSQLAINILYLVTFFIVFNST